MPIPFPSIHVRNNANYSFTDGDDHSAAHEDHLPIAAPGFWWTLVRVRLMIEFRIFAYSLSDSSNPGSLWYRNMYPVVGVQAIEDETALPSGDLPMGGEESPTWVIWEGLQGQPDNTQVSTGGFNQDVRVWRPQYHFLDSHAKRAPEEGTQITVLLAWEWNDPFNLIDRTHGSYDVVYDLNITYAVDCIFQPTPH